MIQRSKIILTLLLFAISLILNAQNQPAGLIPINNDKITFLSDNVYLYIDDSGKDRFKDIIPEKFHKNNGGIINLGITSANVWVRFDLLNNTNQEELFISVAQPINDRVTLFIPGDVHGQTQQYELGEFKKFGERYVNSPNYIFPIKIPVNGVKRFYLKVTSADQIQIPISVGKRQAVLEAEALQNLLFGIYIGLIAIMVLYNLFIYTTVKDISYVYYIVYIIFVGLTQMVLKGYAFKFLWYNNTSLAQYSTILVPVLSGITTALFIKHFLHTKSLAPKLNVGINLFILGYFVCGVIGLFVNRYMGVTILQSIAFIGSIYALIVGWYTMRLGYRPAIFFLIAYSIFLIAIIIFVLTSFNILPYNNITANVLEIGSAIQILLLSLALADKINTYRREEAKARKEALKVSKENERLVREQNVILEQQVNERTQELKTANTNLSDALVQLKNAQAKLVDSEKMVSLGQLTAGIAHEINNPINFVASNVKPLEMDIMDLFDVIKKYEQIDTTQNVDDQLNNIETYKKQIDIDYIHEEVKTLLSGIKEGANRTAEIVSNLKNFVRVDEANVKYVNINEGIESTLLLVRNTFPKDFLLIKNLNAVPRVECIPGKINQVFMNIITNAIQAINEKQSVTQEQGRLEITTSTQQEEVKISIKDNGVGMQQDVINKIYEPFYTTKPIGQGTGLGMSIVKGIIESHHGSIHIESKFGIGTEFTITLPVRYVA